MQTKAKVSTNTVPWIVFTNCVEFEVVELITYVR